MLVMANVGGYDDGSPDLEYILDLYISVSVLANGIPAAKVSDNGEEMSS